MKMKKCRNLLSLIACGSLAFSACQTESETSNPEPSLAEDAAPGLSGTSALAERQSGGWEDGGLDALSSASILRIDRGKFGYVDKTETGYSIKIVDPATPTQTVREKNVPDNANIALWTTGHGGKIIAVTADETAYETFSARQVVVFDQDLRVLKKIPFGAPSGTAEPLHHRDPGLAVTDAYAIAAWEEDSDDWTSTNISVYSLSGGKSGHFLVRKVNGQEEIDSGLGIGSLTAIAADGKFLIAGGTAGTKVYEINASAETIALEEVSGSEKTPGSHWMQNNQTYVIESTAGDGKIRIWRWNGANPPTETGNVSFGTSAGPGKSVNIQAVSFDNENPDRAYVFDRGFIPRGPAGGAPDTACAGEVYQVNLNTSQAEKRFKLPGYEGGEAITGIWTIQVERTGADVYVVLGGTIAGVSDDSEKPARHGVLVLKNPPEDGGDAEGSQVSAALLDFPTVVRTMKTFKTAAGDVFYTAKNYTAPGENFNKTDYKLRLIPLN
jgi:hypothetical protein